MENKDTFKIQVKMKRHAYRRIQKSVTRTLALVDWMEDGRVRRKPNARRSRRWSRHKRHTMKLARKAFDKFFSYKRVPDEEEKA